MFKKELSSALNALAAQYATGPESDKHAASRIAAVMQVLDLANIESGSERETVEKIEDAIDLWAAALFQEKRDLNNFIDSPADINWADLYNHLVANTQIDKIKARIDTLGKVSEKLDLFE